MSQPIHLAYIGVHQIFQLALAAQESDRLGKLYCSLINRPGFWGKWINKCFPSSTANPLDAELIDSASLIEIPYPLMKRSLGRRLRIPKSSIPSTNAIFDNTVANIIRKRQHRLFVGVETCCLKSFQAVKELGGFKILDCPGIPTRILADHISLACQELGIPSGTQSFGEELEIKDREIELADLIFVCSSVQKDYLVKRGIPPDNIKINPLWVNPVFFQAQRKPRQANERLKVIFAGYGSVAKGLPYFLLAKEMLAGEPIDWTIVGGCEQRVLDWAGNRLQNVTLISRQPPAQLMQIFADHHLLVVPSLGDSFGFIVLEAMAAGMPVIASSFTGAPLPDEALRFPMMDEKAIAESIKKYLDQPKLTDQHGAQAQSFARQFTTAAYRACARSIFDTINTQ